jgi:hypothetical protein
MLSRRDAADWQHSKIGKTMLRIASLSLMTAVMAAGMFVGSANADDRDRDGRRGYDRGRDVRRVCSVVKRCRIDDGRYRCRREEVCRLVRVGR